MPSWHPLSKITGPSRRVIVSDGDWVDCCWYDERSETVSRDGEWLDKEDNEYAYQEMPEAPKLPLKENAAKLDVDLVSDALEALANDAARMELDDAAMALREAIRELRRMQK